MELTQKLHELGLVDETDEAALIRTLGRSFARLAEWQLALVGRSIDLDTADTDELMTVLAEASPTIQEVMNYVWRRHMVAVGTRMLLAPGREPEPGDDVDPDSTVLAVGFADIVNYTRQSRTLSQQEIAAMVDAFEARALDIISSHGGRIIKTIGDEILFVADTAAGAALIGLELTEAHLADEQFPELRVGLAYGPVLARLGDVFGPTVNVASRLTGTSRPGRVLCDRELADEIVGDEDNFRLRRLRRTSVKGYRRLEPWSIRRPAANDPHLDPDKQPGRASAFVAEQAQGILRAVHEMDPPGEGPVDSKPTE